MGDMNDRQTHTRTVRLIDNIICANNDFHIKCAIIHQLSPTPSSQTVFPLSTLKWQFSYQNESIFFPREQ